MRIRKYSFYILLAISVVSYFVAQDVVPAVTSVKDGGILTVAFLDVGQGDAIYIEAPNGHQMIVDGGPDGSVMQELAKIMPIGDKTIDTIVITNPDKDHIAGFMNIMNSFEIYSVLEPGTYNDTKIYKDIEDAIIKEGSKKIIARKGIEINLDEKNGVVFSILFPDKDVSDWKSNPGSVIGKLYYGSRSFLLTGDTVIDIENYLVASNGSNLDVDVLKLAHHGSKTSSSQELLQTASPLYAVISAGQDNKYGHPHQEVLNRLAGDNIPYLLTARDGTIVFTTDGENLEIKKSVSSAD